MPIRFITLLLCPIFFICIPAHAEWTGGVEGGTVIRDDGSATRLRFKAANNSRPLSHYLYADWLRTDDGENSYALGYNPRYWINQQLYAFGEARARVDKPLSIDSEQLFVAGVGYQVIASQTTSLWGEAGVGQRSTEFSDNSDNSEMLGIVRAGFYQVLADLLRFEADVDVVSGETLTETTAEAGVAIRVAGGAMKLSYRTRQLKPDGGETVSDSDSFVSFTYGF